jgi:hypothetical protein
VINRTLYIVTCGAPLASRIADGVTASRRRGWQPFVIPTGSSLRWIDTSALEAPVLSEHRASDDSERAPAPDAVAVVPATFNTLNAWANGTANTYPFVKLCAALGAKVPTVAVPFAKHDLAGHPAWLASIAVLRYAGVTMIDPQSGVVGPRGAGRIRNRRSSYRSLQLGMGARSTSLSTFGPRLARLTRPGLFEPLLPGDS